MSFKEQIATDVVDVFLNTDEFAEEITYTPSVGSPSTIKAIFRTEGKEADYEDDGRFNREEATITISTSASGGIESPELEDKVTRNGEIWEVSSGRTGEISLLQGMGMISLRVKRIKAKEKSSESYRIKRI